MTYKNTAKLLDAALEARAVALGLRGRHCHDAVSLRSMAAIGTGIAIAEERSALPTTVLMVLPPIA